MARSFLGKGWRFPIHPVTQRQALADRLTEARKVGNKSAVAAVSAIIKELDDHIEPEQGSAGGRAEADVLQEMIKRRDPADPAQREQIAVLENLAARPIAGAKYEDSVRQSIWIILGTAKGERVMRPDFGCGIYDLVFEVNSPATAARVSLAVREALLFFEPRIDVIDVAVRPDGEGEVMLISIDYEVRATDNVFNLVYPFYLERSIA